MRILSPLPCDSHSPPRKFSSHRHTARSPSSPYLEDTEALAVGQRLYAGAGIQRRRRALAPQGQVSASHPRPHTGSEGTRLRRLDRTRRCRVFSPNSGDGDEDQHQRDRARVAEAFAAQRRRHLGVIAAARERVKKDGLPRSPTR